MKVQEDKVAALAVEMLDKQMSCWNAVDFVFVVCCNLYQSLLLGIPHSFQ